MTSLTGRWSRALQRAATVSFMSTLAIAVAAGPAAANAMVPLHDDHKGRTADYFSQQCGPNNWTPAMEGKDGWHLVLPAEGSDATFVSIELTFEDLDGNEVSKTIPGDGMIVGNGNAAGKHAAIYTDAGWTLLDGTATVTGTEEDAPSKFVVSHTCADTASASPSASATQTPSEVPSESSLPTTDVPTTSSPSEASEAPSETPSAPQSKAPGGGGGLPVTGLALTGVILTGVGMVGAGVAMRALRRRRDDGDESGDEPTDV